MLSPYTPLPLPPYPFFNAWSASGLPADWNQSLLIVGLMTCFMVTLLYMVGYAFNHQHLKSWAKGEFLQVLVTFMLASAMLAGIGVAWLAMENSVTYIYQTTNPALAAQYPGPYDPFGFSQQYINRTLITCEQRVYVAMYWVNFAFKTAGGLKTETIGVDALGGWYTSAYTGIVTYVAGHLNNVFLLHYIQFHFLSIIKYLGPLLIEVGLLLRAFPITRGTGGLMLAAGFGFFSVYPISLALLMSLQPMDAQMLCPGFVAPPLIANGQMSVTNPGQALQIRTDLLASASQISNLISRVWTFVPMFYIQSVFLPMVALIITFTFIRQTGSLFGADLSEIGRGLIKLI